MTEPSFEAAAAVAQRPQANPLEVAKRLRKLQR